MLSVMLDRSQLSTLSALHEAILHYLRVIGVLSDAQKEYVLAKSNYLPILQDEVTRLRDNDVLILLHRDIVHGIASGI